MVINLSGIASVELSLLKYNKQGKRGKQMICVEIDELTPCLKKAETGELFDTEVIRIKRKSFLQKYNKQNGWYVNWSDLATNYEVYALVLKGTVEIQGLVAMKYNDEAQATFVDWMVANPKSNPQKAEAKEFIGIGGHLFAIAVDKSLEYGTNGEFYGFAANQKLLEHYEKSFNAIYVGALHDYHFIIPEEEALKIKEEYNYDWTDDEL